MNRTPDSDSGGSPRNTARLNRPPVANTLQQAGDPRGPLLDRLDRKVSMIFRAPSITWRRVPSGTTSHSPQLNTPLATKRGNKATKSHRRNCRSDSIATVDKLQSRDRSRTENYSEAMFFSD